MDLLFLPMMPLIPTIGPPELPQHNRVTSSSQSSLSDPQMYRTKENAQQTSGGPEPWDENVNLGVFCL